MFGWEHPPFNSGGLGVACRGLLRAFYRKGVDVTFVLPKKVNIDEPYKVLFANSVGSDISDPYMSAYASFSKNLFVAVDLYAAQALKLAAQLEFDIIHAHDWLSFKAALAVKNFTNKPFIAHVHATEIDRTTGHPNPEIYAREYEGVQAADKIISVSAFTKNTLVEHYGVNPEKVEVVHNGIDACDYCTDLVAADGLWKLKKAGYKFILFVGRITIMKGVDYFVWAASLIAELNPKVKFIVAGSGDMEGEIMNLVAKLGLSDRFIFTGFLRGRQLSEVFALADLFVMPSVSEPFGLTPLESLLHQTPVIISKQSGVSEVLDHALKCDYWDTEELADKMLSVIKYKSLKADLSKNGHSQAKQINWDKAAEKCIKIYQKYV